MESMEIIMEMESRVMHIFNLMNSIVIIIHTQRDVSSILIISEYTRLTADLLRQSILSITTNVILLVARFCIAINSFILLCPRLTSILPNKYIQIFYVSQSDPKHMKRTHTHTHSISTKHSI